MKLLFFPYTIAVISFQPVAKGSIMMVYNFIFSILFKCLHFSIILESKIIHFLINTQNILVVS